MSYSSEILADSPLLYYRMGDASGTTMTDSSGGGRNGAYVNSPTLGTTGLVSDANTAVTMASASSQRATVTDDNSLDGLTAITVEAWIKPTTVPSSQAYIISRDGSTNRSFQFRLNNHKVEFIKVPNGTVTASSAASINAGDLRHVAAVYNGTDIRIYINGVLDGTPAATTGDLGTVARDLEIGARSSAGFYDGIIDEVAVYTTALSSTRIAAHYAAGLTTGTLATTLDDATLAASGTVGSASTTGTLATTLDDTTLAASGAEDFVGTAAMTLVDDAPAISGTVANPVGGTFTTTLDGATLSATGTVGTQPVDGTLAASLDDVTISAAGSETIGGTFNTTLDDATLASSGTQTMAGVITVTLDNAAMSATGTETIAGTAAATLDDASIAATGTLTLAGVLTTTLADAALAATAITGTFQDITITATLGPARTASIATDGRTATIATTARMATLESGRTATTNANPRIAALEAT
jgi:hypothetical protein